MSIYDRLCELDERHKRYAKDTNWVDQTGFPVDCSIHDLPTKVFRDAARLLAASRGRAITLSRLSRLALDSAISDRKDQSFTYLLSSTRNAESMSIYNAHMYFIEVLENICGVLNHLFEQAPPNSIEAPPSQGPQPVQNKRFVDWLEQSEPEASPLDAKDNTHQKTTMFWSIVYAYFRDILIIRKHLSQLTTMYKQRTISLVAWYSLNHVAFYMVKTKPWCRWSRALGVSRSRAGVDCENEPGHSPCADRACGNWDNSVSLAYCCKSYWLPYG
jgi:hypothetical protein